MPLLLAAFIMVVFSTCHRQSRLNDLRFETLKVDTVYTLRPDSSGNRLKVEVEMQYPVHYADAAVLDSLRRLTLSCISLDSTGCDLQEAMHRLLESKVALFRSKQKSHTEGDDEEDEVSMPGVYEVKQTVKQEILFNEENILCFSVTDKGVTFPVVSGGEVDTTFNWQAVNYTCVNLDDGTRITDKDIFIEDYQSQLTPILLEKLAHFYQLQSPLELEENGFYDLNEIRPNNNFYLTREGITYVYNPSDQLSIPSVGISQAFIPYSEISFLLSPNSIVKRLY